MHILHVLHFQEGEHNCSAALDIGQISKVQQPHPGHILVAFYKLEWGEGFEYAEGVSCTILAHFYLAFDLFQIYMVF